MLKEHERREYLKSLDEDKRKMEEAHFEEMKKKHREHPKVNVPGSKDQLKEVWEETDGLDPNDFNPKTFFKLHDTNGDGILDEQELEALFTKEVDTNQDRLVTLEEFLKSTETKDFNNPNEDWQTVEETQIYTEDELQRFEQDLVAQETALNQKAEELRKEHEVLQQRKMELDAQKKEYQQAVVQMEQHKAQQVGAVAAQAVGPNGELKFQAQVQEVAGEKVNPEAQQGSVIHPAPPGDAPHPGDKAPETPQETHVQNQQ
ncbi:hypothetical protein AB205_0024450 [Aquarana catesbeiana]|uniref:Nucleobindin-1 n=1 Tax=Aquarana catesbeiana TaxID=8400 RepID=A0A2G9P672_AQUCT|nr:hypothetical protein AB205_0024450 [Aquarana catesbeiana]